MKVYVLIPLILLFSSAFAQESNSILFRAGIGTYSMQSQKQFQQEFNRNSPIRFAYVHSFPAFPTFGGSLGFKVSEKASLGLWAEFASTGGRLHYKDYSGYALMDQVLRSFQVGPFIQYRINKSVEWPIYATFHTSLANINQKLTSEIEIEGEFDSEQYKLKAINYGFRPGIMISRELKPFIFQFGVGAELQFHGDMKVDSNKDLNFQTSDGKSLVSQWDGLRMTLGVGFKL
jgi:hypothetical protein